MYYIYQQPVDPSKSPRLIAMTIDSDLANAIVSKIKHLDLFVSEEKL